MQRSARSIVTMMASAFVALFVTACATGPTTSTNGSPPGLRVDATWPKPLPHGWILGAVAGIAVDADDHVWVLQRPGTLTDDERGATFRPPLSTCCAPAPPVLEFDAAGNLLRATPSGRAEFAARTASLVSHDESSSLLPPSLPDAKIRSVTAIAVYDDRPKFSMTEVGYGWPATPPYPRAG